MPRVIKSQFIPIFLTIVTFFGLWGLLYLILQGLNLLPGKTILLELRRGDILIGLTIYLKTSIDFGIFIGNLMRGNPGWKNRIAIEIGTAFGNAIGTFLVLILWKFFRMVPILMAVMIFVASLVLLRMAENSLEELKDKRGKLFQKLHEIFAAILYPLERINALFSPFLNFLIPSIDTTKKRTLSWKSLIIFSLSVPFILGLDDFAGYIPLFSLVNVYGFILGVFLGHLLLNIFLFLSPSKTTQIVRSSPILFLGSLAFIAIALFGFYECYHLLISP